MTRGVCHHVARVAEARHAHARGWLLTPLNGKVPRQKGWTVAPIPEEKTVEEWARQGNIGLRTGLASEVVVIDDDTDDGSGLKSLDLPKTVTVITGSGKRHLYFKYPEGGVGNSVRKLAPGVDVRGDGGQVVFPGSIHPDTGRPYAWAPGLSPDEVELAELPEHVLEALRGAETRVESGDLPQPARSPGLNGNSERLQRYAQAALTRECETVAGSEEGSRNDTLNRAAFNLGRFSGMGALEVVEIESRLIDAGRSAGLPDKEVLGTVASGLSKGIQHPHRVEELLGRLGGSRTRTRPPPLTDTGNAERLVAQHGRDIRYCHPWRKWLVWDGKRWAVDDRGRIMSRSKSVVRSIIREAARAPEGQRDDIFKWALTSEKLERRRAMVALATSEEGVPVMPHEMDTDPFLLNCLNGTIDFRTGELRAHDRQDLITKLVSVHFDPDATCPLWESVLERVVPDEEVRTFVQRAVGWSLTGDVGEQVLFFCYGLGANGKSVFLRTLLDLLGGDYAIQAAPDMLLSKRGRDHPTELTDLFGARVAVCTEMGAGRHFDEVLVKQLTGGDKVRARRMREDFWEFHPTHHLWLAANHKPIVRGTDHAIWRRILLIPFTVTIPEDDRDPDLLRKLAEERRGILAWVLRGCFEWQRMGLRPPEQVLMATQDYREEMDILGGFLDARVESRTGAQVSAKDLYEAYKNWCETTGEEPLKQRTFGLRLTERGFARRKSRGVHVYDNVRLMAVGETRAEDAGEEGGASGPSSDMNALGDPVKRVMQKPGPLTPSSSLEPQVAEEQEALWEGSGVPGERHQERGAGKPRKGRGDTPARRMVL